MHPWESRAPKHLLVAIDGSSQARQALDSALRIAKSTGGILSIMAVVPKSPAFQAHAALAAPLVEALRVDAQNFLKGALEEADREDVNSSGVNVEGHPAQEICRYASHHGIDLALVGHRGLSTQDIHLVGSVGFNVALFAPSPVMVVRRGGPLRKILVGSDGSDASERAARWAAGLASALGANLTVMYVVPQGLEEVKFTVTRGVSQPFLGPLIESLQGSGVQVSRRVEYGRPSGELVRVAQKEDVDVLVLGRVGKEATEGEVLGGVAAKVLQRAKTNVVLVP